MRVLAEKAREGTLTQAEQEAIWNFERVGIVLALMVSKAHLCLKRASQRKPKRPSGTISRGKVSGAEALRSPGTAPVT
jgi:hypothetical protein